MKPDARIYLDTDIFIHAIEETSPRSDLLLQLFSAVRPGKQFLTTSELSLAELLVKPYEEQEEDLIEQYERILLTISWLEVLPVIQPMLYHAAVLRSRNKRLKLPDAIHISTAIGAGCSHFLTADGGIHDVHSVDLKDGFTRRAEPLVIIRPDKATLTSILQGLAE